MHDKINALEANNTCLLTDHAPHNKIWLSFDLKRTHYFKTRIEYN